MAEAEVIYKFSILSPEVYGMSPGTKSGPRDEVCHKFGHHLKRKAEKEFKMQCNLPHDKGAGFIQSFDTFEELFLKNSEYCLILVSKNSVMALKKFYPRLLVFITMRNTWRNRFIFILLGDMEFDVDLDFVVHPPVQFSVKFKQDIDVWKKLYGILQVKWEPLEEDHSSDTLKGLFGTGGAHVADTKQELLKNSEADAGDRPASIIDLEEKGKVAQIRTEIEQGSLENSSMEWSTLADRDEQLTDLDSSGVVQKVVSDLEKPAEPELVLTGKAAESYQHHHHHHHHEIKSYTVKEEIIEVSSEVIGFKPKEDEVEQIEQPQRVAPAYGSKPRSVDKVDGGSWSLFDLFRRVLGKRAGEEADSRSVSSHAADSSAVTRDEEQSDHRSRDAWRFWPLYYVSGKFIADRPIAQELKYHDDDKGDRNHWVHMLFFRRVVYVASGRFIADRQEDEEAAYRDRSITDVLETEPVEPGHGAWRCRYCWEEEDAAWYSLLAYWLYMASGRFLFDREQQAGETATRLGKVANQLQEPDASAEGTAAAGVFGKRIEITRWRMKICECCQKDAKYCVMPSEEDEDDEDIKNITSLPYPLMVVRDSGHVVTRRPYFLVPLLAGLALISPGIQAVNEALWSAIVGTGGVAALWSLVDLGMAAPSAPAAGMGSTSSPVSSAAASTRVFVSPVHFAAPFVRPPNLDASRFRNNPDPKEIY